MTSLTGRVFGHYRILESVGRGGMATVYRARDRRNNQEVAIKFISPALAEHETFIRRFRREVKVVSRLNHPNIVAVLDYGEQNGYAYQVMPFLKVGSLAHRFKQSPLSLEEGGKMLDQVALALAYAHQHGVLHRDVKPSNILLDQEGNARLADFGMARQVEGTQSLTGSAVIGTPAYMAPEQIQGGPVDARADQYALGVILYQLTTGSLPFEADTPMGYMLKHVNEPFPAARLRYPNVPETIDQVILKATAKKPFERFDSVSEMNQALQAALAYLRDPESNEAPTIALPGGEFETVVKPPPKRSRKPLRIAAAAAAVLFLVLAVPVFSSSFMDLVQQASSPAEGSLNDPLLEVTDQMATIEALSTELASSMSASDDEIEFAVVRTLSAGGASEENPVPTSTKSPAPVILPEPTSIYTSGPTPTAGCAQIALGSFEADGEAVSWMVTNEGLAEVSITRIVLDWPSGNEALIRIFLKGARIWNGIEDTSPSTISSGWTGDRTLPVGASQRLDFVFSSDDLQEGGYDLQVSVIGDC